MDPSTEKMVDAERVGQNLGMEVEFEVLAGVHSETFLDFTLFEISRFEEVVNKMPRPAKRAKLLSDVSSESEEEVPAEEFQVNAEYANRFEHNKKREERHRLEEKYKDGMDESDDSEDETEDDDADLATIDLDDEISATLNAIKSKDPRVYNKDVKFYRDLEEAEGGAADGDKKKDKPMYIQDYQREKLLAGGAADGEDTNMPAMTYQQEQDAMRKNLVGSMHAEGDESADEDDSFLVAKSAPKHETLPTAPKPAGRPRKITDTDVAAASKDPETYLSNFMAARAWLPSEGYHGEAFESEDSADDERADQFEQAYNLRFEDPKGANEKLVHFSRNADKGVGARREEQGGRKRAREREREQKEYAKREREEEKTRLRNMRIEEAEEKVQRIKDAAGLRGQKGVDLEEWRDVIEGEFDDDRWEVEMKRRFGDDYYAAQEDADVGSDEEVANGSKKHRKIKKPKWDDDLDIKDLVPDFETEEKPTATLSSDDEDEDDSGAVTLPDARDADDEEASSESLKHTTAPAKRKSKKERAAEKTSAKRTARLERRAIESMVDASIPTIPTTSDNSQLGFRYRETSPQNFGLTSRDILFADDKQLNEYAGLKKMAGWRDADKKKRDKKKFSKKARLRAWRKETFGSEEGPVEAKVSEAHRDGGQADVDGGGKDIAEVKEGGKKRKRSRKGKGVGAA